MNSVRSIGGVPRTKALPTVRTFPFSVGLLADQDFRINGVTRDANGTILGNCVVHLFFTASDVIQAVQTSDPTTGAYSIIVQPPPVTYYAVAYKAGSPDVAGTTINTLTGV